MLYERDWKHFINYVFLIYNITDLLDEAAQ